MKISTLRTAVLCSLLVTGLAEPAKAGPADGMVGGATKIFDSGPDGDRFNLVLIAEGYQSGELPNFAADAQQFLDFFKTTPPFDASCMAFNVWRIDVESTDSGADDPESPLDDETTMDVDESTFCGSGGGATVDTYFDATFCADGKIRRLLGVNNATAISVMDSEVPDWDEGIVIVNSTIYGGQGGSPGTTSLSGTWENIAIHEVGHSVFGLADEYEYRRGCSSGETDRDEHDNTEPVQPNVTVETDATLLKWKDLLETGVPTTSNSDCTVCDPQSDPFSDQVVGLYEGAHYYHCKAYRSVFSCMMRNFSEFCPVCKAQIADVLEPFQPENVAPVCDAGGPYEEECNGMPPSLSLDGSGSSDDGCLLTFLWSGPFSGGTSTEASPTVEFNNGPDDYTVSLEVGDGVSTTSCDAEVSIVDTTDPDVTAPSNVTEECVSPAGTPVELGDPVVSDICDPTLVVDNDAPALFPVGETPVLWTATDSSANVGEDTQLVTVEDTIPPLISVSVSPDVLWPPNHKMVTIQAEIEVIDICDPDPAVTLVSIVSNEPDDDTGDGATTGDIQEAAFGTDDREFSLRAERKGDGEDRVYTITYEVEDMSGNTAQAQAIVTVPHSKRP